jgi:hypothetical protein
MNEGIPQSSSSSVHTTTNSAISNSFDWNNNFYYIRCSITSAVNVGATQTLYGVSLTFI